MPERRNPTNLLAYDLDSVGRARVDPAGHSAVDQERGSLAAPWDLGRQTGFGVPGRDEAKEGAWQR